ncbi:hypothetical protein [Anaeroselena agilis]|uniref:Glycosyl hydrolase family 32 N-terminal domain-containing protein n=1 Tax=Anaeroselena agilis TaxID=3063788 RepID=A0ABU3NUC2_9FIRM|nr:hypothetical protein [Selenomonadales bacterium 4137-cl]
MRAFAWNKRGLLFEPNIEGFTHGSHPCVLPVRDDLFIIAFTCRDRRQRSHIFLSRARVGNGVIELAGSPRLALLPGPPGHFDCDGAISVCFVRHKQDCYLYYVGWQNLAQGLWHCDTGRVVVDPEKLFLAREFPGPVMGVNKDHPLFVAGTAFLVEDGLWRSWFNSGLKWERLDNGELKPYYGIHYATSNNGIDWDLNRSFAIPFADEYEYAFGRPCVTVIDGMYYMWFAHRATKDIATYRMGFAASKDGLVWDRDDSLAGIDVSPAGWDSEMICYPYVFEHDGWLYMLYNGNAYGKTGFGYAVCKKDG